MSEWTRKETAVTPAANDSPVADETAATLPATNDAPASDKPENEPTAAPIAAQRPLQKAPRRVQKATCASHTRSSAPKEASKAPNDGTPLPQAAETAVVSSRYTARGTRRGQYRTAAWLGLVVILLAVVGLVSLGILGVRLVQKATDHTELMNELADFAAPVIEYRPAPFASIEEADQSTLLLASIYRITEAERIRQAQERTDEYLYETDDYGRLIISIKEVDASFAVLFGSAVTPVHRTLGEKGGVAYTYEYDKPNACYHVPTSVSFSLYTTVVDDIKVSGKTARIRVGYALTAQLDIDNKGNLVPPTSQQIETYRWLTFTESGTGWILTSVAEESSSTVAPSAASTSPKTTSSLTTAPTSETTADTTATSHTTDTAAEPEDNAA